MPVGVYKRTEKHLEILKKARSCRNNTKHSEDTKKKIGDANRNQIYYKCDYCNKDSSSQPSAYKKKKKHFCSQACYSNFVREKIPFNEQRAYKGVRKESDSKQVYHRNYCKKHPEKISHLKTKDYARKKNAAGTHSLEEWNNLKNDFNNLCAYCKEKKKLTKDHIIPLSKGGSNYISNIQPLCRNCNSKKHNKLNYIHQNPELLECEK